MDPFREVLNDAEASLKQARERLEAYRRSRDPGRLADVGNTMQELTETAHDLSQSVASAQREPARFGVDAAEISNRIRQVGDINRQISELQALLDEVKSSHQPSVATGELGMVGQGLVGSSQDEEAGRDLLYQQAIQEQDNVLDSVHDTVATLREQAHVMSRELEDQAMMLDDFDEHAETAGDRLRQGLKRVDWVLRNNQNTLSSCCITLLIIALIVLLVLVIIL